MRGNAARPVEMLPAVSPDALVPQSHSVRRIKPLVNRAVTQRSSTFDRMYAADGRPSNPPEYLLAAWASLKNFRPRDGNPPAGDGARNDGGRNPQVEPHGQRRPNEAHHSTPDAATAGAEHQPGDCQEDDHRLTAPVERGPGKFARGEYQPFDSIDVGIRRRQWGTIVTVGVVNSSFSKYLPGRWLIPANDSGRYRHGVGDALDYLPTRAESTGR